jgi:hypothetical protein
MSPTQLKKIDNIESEDLLAVSEKKELEGKTDRESREILPSKEKESQTESGKEKSTQSEKQKPVKVVHDFTAPPQASPVKSQTLIQIEDIMEQDLADIYSQMDKKRQKKFKLEGEKTASKIEYMLGKTRDATKKIFKLILHWLNIIPGVNNFFIKQEALIKTEKIVKLKEGDR